MQLSAFTPQYAVVCQDTDYFQGPAGVGGTPQTIRVVAYVTDVPSAAQRILYMNESSGVSGGRVFTGLVAGQVQALFGNGAFQITPAYTVASSDVGKILIIHAWVDTVAHLAINGAEVGTGSAAVTVGAPGAAARVTVGRSQWGAGFAGSTLAPISICQSSTAITLAEVAADAAAIRAGVRVPVLPQLPGETLRYVASDVYAGGDWHDQDGDDCTLTRVGSPNIFRVP